MIFSSSKTLVQNQHPPGVLGALVEVDEPAYAAGINVGHVLEVQNDLPPVETRPQYFLDIPEIPRLENVADLTGAGSHCKQNRADPLSDMTALALPAASNDCETLVKSSPGG